MVLHYELVELGGSCGELSELVLIEVQVDMGLGPDRSDLNNPLVGHPQTVYLRLHAQLISIRIVDFADAIHRVGSVSWAVLDFADEQGDVAVVGD